jgi:hypothetical protein
MGLFDRFSKKPSEQYINLLDSAIAQIRGGIHTRLAFAYSQSLPKRDAELLSGAVLSFALMERPMTQDAAAFMSDKRERVKAESHRLAGDPEIAKALSYLYAAQSMRITFDTKNPLAMRIIDLGNQASLLAITIPSTVEICGTEDNTQCIIAISRFASAFARKARDTGKT